MASRSHSLVWSITPVAALIVAISAQWLSALPGFVAPLIILLLLAAAIFASVHYADVIAHRTGEPYGTLVLTVAITVIEVALIVSIMITGDGSPTLARDTVFAVIMIILTGVVGLCLVIGGLRFGEVGFRVSGASAYLIVLLPLAVVTLVLPNYTVSADGPFYSTVQLAFVALTTLLLYSSFLYVQTVRHRDYFLSDTGEAPDEEAGQAVDDRTFVTALIQLVVALTAVVLLAKSLSGSLTSVVAHLPDPSRVLGLLVALLVLMPETVAAYKSARRNAMQKSLNLALGSSLATIGLTIPVVGALSIYLGTPLALGLEPRDIAMLVLTFAVSMLTFGRDRATVLPGLVHLVLFGLFVFMVFAP